MIGLLWAVLTSPFKSKLRPDPYEHRRAAKFGDEYERLDRGLRFRQRGLFLWKASNVCCPGARKAQQSRNHLAFRSGLLTNWKIVRDTFGLGTR